MPMRKSRGARAQAIIVVLLSLFISMFVSLAVPPQPASAKRLEIDDLTAYLDQVFRQAYPDDEPGGAVLVVKDGETLLREGYGIADMELGVPVTPDMVFRLGSLTKQFTAVIVMMLAEENVLSLQDEITTHLPDYPPPAQVVTIEHLLTHTSGIPSYTDNSEVMASADQDRTVDEVIAIFEDEPLQFAPGSQWRYSNSGYFLLGAIIEAVTDKTYAEVVQERIFDPLEMRNSYYGNFEQIIPGRARGYHREEDIYTNAPTISMTMPYAAGSLLSTVDDLARWDAALHAGELLPREVLDRMWSAYTLTNGEETGYGYGWMIADFDNKRVLQHGGGIHGFSTFALSVPEEKVYVAVLSNNPHTRHASTQWLAQKATSALLGQPLEWESVEVDSAILERYVGVYEIDPETERVVTVEDGKLFTQRTGGMKNQTAPASETEFFYHHSLA
jgi:CubicO group peptidase (beta-lactamase class C family)